MLEYPDNKNKVGSTKMIFEEAAVPGIFSMKYIKENGNIVNTTATYESGIFKFSYWYDDIEWHMSEPSTQITGKHDEAHNHNTVTLKLVRFAFRTHILEGKRRK